MGDVPSVQVQDEYFPDFAFGSAMSPLEQLDLPFGKGRHNRILFGEYGCPGLAGTG